MLIKLSFGIFIVTFYYISQKDSNSEFESFKNVAFKLICDAVWIPWVTEVFLTPRGTLLDVHPDSGRTWSAGLWMGSLSVPCILRSGPLESCSLVICRLVVWPLLWLSLLFAVVISECLPYFPIYSLIPVASVVFIIHLFVFSVFQAAHLCEHHSTSCSLQVKIECFQKLFHLFLSIFIPPPSPSSVR